MESSRRTSWRALVMGMFLLAGLSHAAAQGKSAAASTADADYDLLVDRGVQEAALHNYAEARSLFLEAHELFPNARTLRALGMVEYELRNYVAALPYLSEALQSDVRPLDDEKRGQVAQLLKQAKSYVARYTLRVTPANALIELDDSPVTADRQGGILLAVGDHTLRVSASGYRSTRRTLRVAGGRDDTLMIVLVAEGSGANAAKSTDPLGGNPRQVDDATPLRKKWWLWTAVGIVAAGAAAGTAIALTRRDDATQANGGTSMSVLKGPKQ